MFIGHSDSINYVSFTPDMSALLTVGEAIFVWDFMASSEAVDRSEQQIPELVCCEYYLLDV